MLGFGTQGIDADNADSLLKLTYELGARLYDTALAYNNLLEISKALKGYEVEFICKIDYPNISEYGTKKCVDLILTRLNIPIIDILLIHAPKNINHIKVYNEMLELKHQKKIKKCGVSNYTIKHIELLKQNNLLPEVSQVEIHPYLVQEGYIKYCKKNNINLTAHTPFAHGYIFKDEILNLIAQELNISISQLVLKWLIRKAIIPIFFSQDPVHIKNNFSIIDGILPDSIIKRINLLNKNLRICNNPVWAEF